MRILTMDDIQVGQYITFINPIWSPVNIVNQMEQTITKHCVENMQVVGKIYKVEAVDLPFILVTDTISNIGFTIDIRNLQNQDDIREIDIRYRKKFKKLFSNMQSANVCSFTTNSNNAGLA